MTKTFPTWSSWRVVRGAPRSLGDGTAASAWPCPAAHHIRLLVPRCTWHTNEFLARVEGCVAWCGRASLLVMCCTRVDVMPLRGLSPCRGIWARLEFACVRAAATHRHHAPRVRRACPRMSHVACDQQSPIKIMMISAFSETRNHRSHNNQSYDFIL